MKAKVSGKIDFEDLVRIGYVGVYAITILLSLFVMLVGIFSYKKLGGYLQYDEDFWNYVLRRPMNKVILGKDPLTFGCNSIAMVVFILCAIRHLFICLLNIIEDPFKGFVGLFGPIGGFGAMLYFFATKGPDEDINMKLAICCGVMLLGLFIGFWKSEYGIQFLINIGAIFAHFFGIAIILYVAQIGIVQSLGAVAAFAILYFFGGAMLMNAEGPSGSKEGSSSSNGSQKARREFEKAQKRIDAEKHGRKMHNKGAIGYGHVNEKASLMAQRKAEADRDFWAKKM